MITLEQRRKDAVKLLPFRSIEEAQKAADVFKPFGKRTGTRFYADNVDGEYVIVQDEAL